MLGRFNSIDPKAEKHYTVTPYASMNNNPVVNIDPLGDDWFVNSTNGDVIFVRGYSKIDQNTLDNFKYGGHDVNEYERLGPDNMFGDKVIVNNYGDDVLKADFVAIEDPVNFMETRGYGLAEKVKIEEKVYTSGGSMGHGENITNTHGDLTQIGKAKITYAKPQDMNKKDNLKVDEIAGKYSSIKTAKYNLTKPKGQDNRKTAYFYENKKNSVSQQDAGFVKEAIEFFKQAFKKK